MPCIVVVLSDGSLPISLAFIKNSAGKEPRIKEKKRSSIPVNR
jgi:hypothetical protein